jgi:hypothetical protein
MRVSSVLFVGTFGVLLGVVIAVSKLLGATVARDVETLCNAESASGFAVHKNAARVTAWTQDHLETGEGGRLLASLRDLPLDERAPWLQQRSRAAGISSCPMVSVYDELYRQWRSKQELQHLCSAATFPDLDKLDDAERLQAIEEWLTLHASMVDSRRLGSRLSGVDSAAAAAELMRDAANDVGLLSCDVARILTVPAIQSCSP